MIEALALRRRTRMERAAIALLRGAPAPQQQDGGPDGARSQISIMRCKATFSALRRRARAAGMIIRQINAQFVSEDELLILGWVAEKQRNCTVLPLPRPDSPMLDAVGKCAASLQVLGVRVPPQPRFIGAAVSRRDFAHQHRSHNHRTRLGYD